MNAIFHRVSIRKYQERTVEQEKITLMLRAAMKVRMKKVRNILNIPDDLEPFALVPCGYPAEERPKQDRYEEERVHYI